MAIRITEELISVREAARECGRNMETVRRWIWAGKLPAEKLGNQLFIKKSELTAFCRKLSKQEAATNSVFSKAPYFYGTGLELEPEPNLTLPP